MAGKMQSELTRWWDVIVVGAGPAGCSAAYDLVLSGRRVLLLDKNDFPRSKACAGGLTMKTVQALRYSVEPVTRQLIRHVSLESKNKKSPLLEGVYPFVVMTVRSEFDDYCFKKTKELGADFLRIRGIKRIKQDGKGVTVETETETLQAKFVIGADGANSVVRQFCTDLASVKKGFALEAQLPMQSETRTVTIDVGAVKDGAAWIFPKGDHLNVGLYVINEEEHLSRKLLLDYIRRKFGSEIEGQISHVVGQYLNSYGWEGRCAQGRVLLAGDAAGLTDVMTGEGIYSAVLSGQIAAQAIEEHLCGRAVAADAYQKGLRPLINRLSLSARAASPFYSNPNFLLNVLSIPGVSSLLMKAYTRNLGAHGSGPSRSQILARKLTYGLLAGLGQKKQAS
ncbi:geranylgeranyl reductase family protein [Terriglobus saanensis]|uniref:Geranylgeranyl reductase n=1 Tax=Terriglobus saanensis (strain ATCC BAA-1853 / DSM 23119 / SP1PR4) TaxID=401053 RepID=E8V7M8_TERSS|nr:geranylgeranyl reductase family protein [Terriglobus saanensis]ADV81726.1 geranylgeranyl reductase [Terriglobus saanensis SP1PR4]